MCSLVLDPFTSKTWTISDTLTAEDNYKIKICGTSSTTNCDESDNFFTIIGPLSLIYPIGGEQFTRGNTYTIGWEENIEDTHVSIKLYKAGIEHGTIETSTNNNGVYSWDVPVAQTVGTDYKIKICSTSSTIICTESPSYFTIQ